MPIAEGSYHYFNYHPIPQAYAGRCLIYHSMATYKKPDFFPRHIVQRLRQDLVSAQKNIDEYEELSMYSVPSTVQLIYPVFISCILIYCTAKHSE